jgi:hypothetical protein
MSEPARFVHAAHSTLTPEMQSADLARMAFRSRQLLDGQRFVRQGAVGQHPDPLAVLPDDAAIDHHVTGDARTTVLASTELGTILIDAGVGDTHLSVCATTRDASEQLYSQVVQRFPTPPRDDDVPIAVWYMGPMAPVATRKRLSAPPWDDIAINYPHTVRRHLAELASISGGGNGGKLIIWHGPPGTGKTTALRSLIRSWQPWCGTHYIIDPERFFAHPGYIVELLATSSSPARTMTANAHDDATGDRWQLVVAEDCDEYLRATARRDAGAALGRLLNLSDGILGQGHRTLILLTTNEELHRLHPALTRPGRCLAVIEFAKFEPAEARQWLDNAIAPPTTPSTLAELYEHSGQIIRLTHDEPRPAVSGHYL